MGRVLLCLLLSSYPLVAAAECTANGWGWYWLPILGSLLLLESLVLLYFAFRTPVSIPRVRNSELLPLTGGIHAEIVRLRKRNSELEDQVAKIHGDLEAANAMAAELRQRVEQRISAAPRFGEPLTVDAVKPIVSSHEPVAPALPLERLAPTAPVPVAFTSLRSTTPQFTTSDAAFFGSSSPFVGGWMSSEVTTPPARFPTLHPSGPVSPTHSEPLPAHGRRWNSSSQGIEIPVVLTTAPNPLAAALDPYVYTFTDTVFHRAPGCTPAGDEHWGLHYHSDYLHIGDGHAPVAQAGLPDCPQYRRLQHDKGTLWIPSRGGFVDVSNVTLPA
eukprot:TRINITY_DN8390_c0_g1_i2.p1 TRINITY_DN8390_c0_g1~~TRINITY_DN8390_c0_g1_i2.p1  ORF type:complete len:340 (+),score=25.61 TRINITY_DN8390_c0_g1_i2:31-1020(+)